LSVINANIMDMKSHKMYKEQGSLKKDLGTNYFDSVCALR